MPDPKEIWVVTDDLPAPDVVHFPSRTAADAYVATAERVAKKYNVPRPRRIVGPYVLQE